jgi:hypothetical protein
MPSPRRKRVSDEVMVRISEAIDKIAADDQAPRTKRQIEAISGLGHDAVARAFRQDSVESAEYRLNERLNALLTPEGSGRRSPEGQERHEAEIKIAELRHRVRELDAQLDRYGMALYAHALSAGTLTSEGSSDGTDPVPMRRQRKRK